MSEDTEQKFGLEGIEQSQGFERMPVSSPVDTPEPDHMSEHELSHLRRPEPPAPEVREYRSHGGAGDEIDPKYTVSAEQAAHDIGLARDSERQVREDQAAQDLRSALDQTGQEQPAQPDDLQPEHAPDHAQADPYAEADRQITEMLKDPVVRERIQAEYDQIKTTAAAEAKQEVERAHALASAVQNHYAQSTEKLVQEASGIIGALFPELNGLSGERLQGALAIMQQTNPQRVQQLQHLASRAQGLVEAQARQQHEAAQGQVLQREAALEQYTSANVKEYENWSSRDNPETLKSIRENLKPTVEKYGVPFETLMAIHNGKLQVDATTFVRSAAFQKMLHNSIKYELASRAVTEARFNPIPKVQRPGVAPDGPSDNNEYASLERQFRGKDLSAKQAANLLIAHRAGSR